MTLECGGSVLELCSGGVFPCSPATRFLLGGATGALSVLSSPNAGGGRGESLLGGGAFLVGGGRVGAFLTGTRGDRVEEEEGDGGG